MGRAGAQTLSPGIPKEPLLHPLPDFACLPSSRFKPRRERFRANQFSYRGSPSNQVRGFQPSGQHRESLRVVAPLTRPQSTPLVMVCLRRSPRARGACRPSPVPTSRVLQDAAPVADSRGHRLVLGLHNGFLSPSRTLQLTLLTSHPSCSALPGPSS